MDKSRSQCFVLIILISSIVFTYLSYVRGLYSWDFFTLWGTHPKLVWATGNFFTSGLDLPLQFKYQSIWGSLTGIISYLINPNSYFDGIWILSNQLIIFSLLGCLIYFSDNRFSKIKSIAFISAFIPATLMGQQAWGGYVDLTGVLFLCVGLLLYDKNRIYLSALFFLGCVFTKMNLWPWIFILGACLTMVNFNWLSIRKFLIGFVLPIILGIVILAIIYPKEKSSDVVKFWTLMFRMESIHYILGVFGTALTSLNGVLLIVLVWAIYKKDKFVILYLLSGLSYITLAYLMVLEPSATESYPSIKRYIFPLVFPLMFYLLERIKYVERRSFIYLILILSLVRLSENYKAIAGFQFSHLSDYCNVSKITCEMKDLIVESNGNPKKLEMKTTDIYQYPNGSDLNPSAIFFVGLPENYIYLRKSEKTQEQDSSLKK